MWDFFNTAAAAYGVYKIASTFGGLILMLGALAVMFKMGRRHYDATTYRLGAHLMDWVQLLVLVGCIGLGGAATLGYVSLKDGAQVLDCSGAQGAAAATRAGGATSMVGGP